MKKQLILAGAMLFAGITVANAQWSNTSSNSSTTEGSTSNNSIQMESSNDSGSLNYQGSILSLRRSYYTGATKGDVLDTWTLGAIDFLGHAGNKWNRAAQIQSQVVGTPNTTLPAGKDYVMGNILFKTTNSLGTNAIRMLIDPEGNVGIGTTVPLEKLHINNAYALFKSGSNTNNSAHSTGIKFTTDVDGNEAQIVTYRGSSSAHTGIQFNTYDAGLERTMTLVDGTVFVGDIENFNGTNTTNYRLQVEGKVRTEEVKVYPKLDWSDFVFESNYNLRPLSEVRSFIDLNGHLPEIPSAETVAEDGFELGSMDAKLLMKIEELTLYMLEHEERLNNLENENAQLKSENEALRAQLGEQK